MTKEKIVGIIGCGSVTQKFYVPSLSKMSGIRVRYVFDLNGENANIVASKFSAEVMEIEKMISNSDIIIVATPPDSHYKLIKQCLVTNKVVVTEKPFVVEENQAIELFKILKENNNSRLYVAHVRRCYPNVKLARELVYTGILGDIKKIEMFEGGRFNYTSASGYTINNKYGGVLFDTGSHTIDTALFITNLDTKYVNFEVKKVERNKPEPSHEIKSEFECKIDNKKIEFSLFLSRLKVLANRIKIVGTNGSLDISIGLTNSVRLYGDNGSVILYSDKNFNNIMDVFPVQYYQIFNNIDNEKFSAEKFINLTQILDKIFNKKSNI